MLLRTKLLSLSVKTVYRYQLCVCDDVRAPLSYTALTSW